MKIRRGFVSNSSSTSFCIYGWDDMSDENIKKFESMKEETYDYLLKNRFIKTNGYENYFCIPDHSNFIGVGSIISDGDDYCSAILKIPETLKSQLDDFAKKNNIELPKEFKGTFYF